MRVIKLAVISIVVLFVILTLFSLLLPSRQIISRAININAPLDTVHMLVNDLSLWRLWMDNFDQSSSVLTNIKQGKGASITMDEVKVVITQSTKQQVAATWQSGSNRPLDGEFNFIPHDSSSQLTVQWQFTQQVQWYPWVKFASIVSDQVIGPHMEKSLDNLKKVAEGEEITTNPQQ